MSKGKQTSPQPKKSVNTTAETPKKKDSSVVNNKYSWISFIALAITISVIALNKSAKLFFVNSLWDDSNMIGKYVYNFINYGEIAWNHQQGPAWGLTSCIYIFFVLPVYKFFVTTSVSKAIAATSMIFGIAFMGLFSLFIKKYITRNNYFTAMVCLVVLLIMALKMEDKLAYHFTSGMDTMLSLFYMTALLFAFKHYETHPSRKNLILYSILGGLSFSIRPDLLLFALGIPGLFMVLNNSKQSRIDYFISALVVGAVALVQSGLYYIYFKSFVPLPFYVKKAGFYGADFEASLGGISNTEFNSFMEKYTFLLVIIAADIIVNRKFWFSLVPRLEKAALVCLAAYFFYFIYMALPIMAFHSRFFYPGLPCLLFLAFSGINRFSERMTAVLSVLNKYSVNLVASIVIALLCLFAINKNYTAFTKESRRAVKEMYDPAYYYNAKWRWYWYKLDKFAKLPADFKYATSELGLPAVISPEKEIIDYAGLHDSYFAQNGFKAEELFRRNPDLIYLPHPSYKKTTDDILNNPIFKTDYIYYQPEQLGVKRFGIALNKKSKYLNEMNQVLTTP